MSGFLPARRSKWWIVVFFGYTAAEFAIFIMIRSMIQQRPVDTKFASAAAVLSLVTASATCILGYFNAKIVFAVTTAGVFAGMVMMLVTVSRNTGWESLIGVILFLELSLLGFASGVFAEVVYFLFRVTRGKGKRKAIK